MDAFADGRLVVAVNRGDGELSVNTLHTATYNSSDGYIFNFHTASDGNESSSLILVADTEDDYPSDGDNGGGGGQEPV